MITSLVVYIIGCIVIAIMLCRDIIGFFNNKEIAKDILLGICISLLWPIYGVWMLWEMVEIWLVCRRNQVEKFRK